MTKNNEWNIHDIEALTEEQAADMALEKMVIKGHNIYFVDFGGYFGYSALVFMDNHHIRYADDYELHHKGNSREELKQFYIDRMNNILFTDDEFSTINNYNDRQKKLYYIMNYYPMRRYHVSIFGINKDDEDVSNMIYNPVGLCYFNKEDEEFSNHILTLFKILKKAMPDKNNYEYWYSAFLCEMENHEYPINWQADYDVCSCFGNCENVKDYTDTNKLFEVCGFSDTQKLAYVNARKKIMTYSYQ